MAWGCPGRSGHSDLMTKPIHSMKTGSVSILPCYWLELLGNRLGLAYVTSPNHEGAGGPGEERLTAGPRADVVGRVHYSLPRAKPSRSTDTGVWLVWGTHSPLMGTGGLHSLLQVPTAVRIRPRLQQVFMKDWKG